MWCLARGKVGRPPVVAPADVVDVQMAEHHVGHRIGLAAKVLQRSGHQFAHRGKLPTRQKSGCEAAAEISGMDRPKPVGSSVSRLARRVVLQARQHVERDNAFFWTYQAIRKPTELFFPVSGVLAKTPRDTWQEYGAAFRRFATPAISPELLAALAQVEGSGNPLVRTYWRWAWERH